MCLMELILLVAEMAPRPPKGFGVKLDEAKGNSAKLTRTHPEAKKDASKNVCSQDRSPKRKQNITPEGAPSKKLRTTSLVESQLGPLVVPFVQDDELTSWKNLKAEDENNAMIRASAQLLIHSLGRASRLEKEVVRLKELEADKHKLSKQVKTAEQEVQRVCEERDAQYRVPKKELADQDEILQTLNDTIDAVNKENSKLKARPACSIDHQKLEDENFEKGFNFYLLGFVANDTEYSFEKFGEETVVWGDDFKLKNVATIKQKRIELGLESLEEEDDASSPIMEETSVHTGNTPPPEDHIPPQDHPENVPPATPLQIMTPLRLTKLMILQRTRLNQSCPLL